MKIRKMYMDHVDIYNDAAKLNGYKDASQMKIVDYESKTFKDEMENTWQGLKPLYQQLHAYVRYSKKNDFKTLSLYFFKSHKQHFFKVLSFPYPCMI